MLRIRGLPNVGNTCYQNAALQLLLSIPEFSQFLSTEPMEGSFNTEGQYQWLGDFLHLIYLYHNSDDQEDVNNAYRAYYRNICQSRRFKLGQQDDANLVLTQTVLDSLADQYLEYPLHLVGKKTLYPEINPVTHNINLKLAHHFFDNGDASKGRPRLLGSQVNNSYELFLPLLQEGTSATDLVPVYSLGQLFTNFRKVEIEEGQATDPTIKRKALKRIFQNQVTQLDKYFFLRLGREDTRIFLADGGFGKLTHPVRIPHLINIRQLVDQEPASKPHLPSKHAYALVGVVHHLHSTFGQASLHSGHYTASVLHGKHWYYCDDTNVQPMKKNEIDALANSDTGYIYLFKRLDGLTTGSAERLAPVGPGINLNQLEQLRFVSSEYQFPFEINPPPHDDVLVSDDEFKARFNGLVPTSPVIPTGTASLGDDDDDELPAGF